MHPYAIPAEVKERVMRRQGKLPSHDTIDAARTALIVIDMQNYFVAEGFPLEVPAARDIVPNINRLARAVRAAGGTVVWVQTTAKGALESWGNHHKYMLTPERAKTRLAQSRRERRRLCALSEARAVAERSARQEAQIQRLYCRLVRHRGQAQEPRHREPADRRYADECLLRVDGARRHDARLSRRHGLGLQRDPERRDAREFAEQFRRLFRRRDDDGRDVVPARAGREARRSA